jgi:hypothetical protein
LPQKKTADALGASAAANLASRSSANNDFTIAWAGFPFLTGRVRLGRPFAEGSDAGQKL